MEYIDAFDRLSLTFHTSQRIEVFSEAFLRLENLNITPKIHVIIHHVYDFCRNQNSGLGKWSEQASEAVHADFELSSWSNYKVSSLNPRFGEQLLHAVTEYASKHV